MAKEPHYERRSLMCPRELFDDCEELLTFIQLRGYTKAFLEMELTDDEQRTIEIGIMMNPLLNPVISGTGGIRVFECGTPSHNVGSLQLSVFYTYFPEAGKVALIGIFQTDSIAEMSESERSELKSMFEELQTYGPEAWEESD